MTTWPMTRPARLRMFSYRCPECGEPPLMTGGRVTVPHPETCVYGRRVRRMIRREVNGDRCEAVPQLCAACGGANCPTHFNVAISLDA